MIDTQILQNLSESEVFAIEDATKQLLQKLSKYEISSVKAMIMPPIFSYNVLKLVLILHKPQICLDQSKMNQITWNSIKKDLLKRSDIFLRKCESINLIGLQQEHVQAFQRLFQDTYQSFGSNLLGKAQLYGHFISTMCNWTINIRSLMHAYKAMRTQD